MLIRLYRARRSDTVETFDPVTEQWLWTFFVEEETGARILVAHGTTEGIWPPESIAAIQQYNPELIFCCHPKIMKQRTGDLRIQGIHNDKVEIYGTKTQDGDYVYLSLMKV